MVGSIPLGPCAVFHGTLTPLRFGPSLRGSS